MKKKQKQKRRYDRFWMDIEGDDVLIFKNDKLLRTFPIDYSQENIFHQAEAWLSELPSP